MIHKNIHKNKHEKDFCHALKQLGATDKFYEV